MDHIGKTVRRLREERGLNQAQLAVSVGTGPSAISQIENGKRSPNSETLVKLARALEVEVAELFPKDQAPLQLELEEQRGAEEKRRTQRYLHVMQLFASEMNRQWAAIVERDDFTKEDFEKGAEVFRDFDDAFVEGIGTDLLGALREGEITLSAGERESFDNAKASLDAWQRTMWSAYDALKIRGVPNVTPLFKGRGERKHDGQPASVQNAREPAEEVRRQSSA